MSLFQAGRWMQRPVVWHVTSGSSHMNFIIFSFFHLLIKDRFALTLLTYSYVMHKIKKRDNSCLIIIKSLFIFTHPLSNIAHGNSQVSVDHVYNLIYKFILWSLYCFTKFCMKSKCLHTCNTVFGHRKAPTQSKQWRQMNRRHNHLMRTTRMLS